MLSKEPLKQWESALVNIPLVEIQIATDYNQGKSLNHYDHLKAGSYQEYLQILRNYQLKSLEFQGKLNLPSFGTINDTKERSLFLPMLMQSYVRESPVPIVHYQRSYMKFLDEILREYVGGQIDISARVSNRIRERQGDAGRISAEEGAVIDRQAQQNNSFDVKLTGFLSDMLVLFSDFDETAA